MQNYIKLNISIYIILWHSFNKKLFTAPIINCANTIELHLVSNNNKSGDDALPVLCEVSEKTIHLYIWMLEQTYWDKQRRIFYHIRTCTVPETVAYLKILLIST